MRRNRLQLGGDGLIPAYAEGYAAALMASHADLGLGDIRDVCNGLEVPGYEMPAELRAGQTEEPASI